MASGAGKGLFGFFQGLFGGGKDLTVGAGSPSDRAVDAEAEAIRMAYMAVPADDPQREEKLKRILDLIEALRAKRGK